MHFIHDFEANQVFVANAYSHLLIIDKFHNFQGGCPSNLQLYYSPSLCTCNTGEIFSLKTISYLKNKISLVVVHAYNTHEHPPIDILFFYIIITKKFKTTYELVLLIIDGLRIQE